MPEEVEVFENEGGLVSELPEKEAKSIKGKKMEKAPISGEIQESINVEVNDTSPDNSEGEFTRRF